MVCWKCGSRNIDFMVSLFISAPIKYYAKITKSNLTKKELRIVGADWPQASFSCNDCGFLMFPDRKYDPNFSSNLMEASKE